MCNIGNCLLCCDLFEELRALKRICGSSYIIAVNRYQFYKQIKNSEERANFIESNEINPYETIWEILDQIHVIIDEEIKDRFSDYFIFHIM